MAEGDRVPLLAQHPGGEARAERIDVVGRDALEQPELRTRGHDGDDVEHAARRGVERGRTGEHRVAHRRGELRLARGEHLRDVERVPAREREDRIRIAAGLSGERADGVERERRDGAARDARRRRELAEQHAQRMTVGEVVAVRREHERLSSRRCAGRAPAARRATPRRPSARPRAPGPSAGRAPPRARARPRAAPAPASTRAANVPPTGPTRSTNGPSGVGVVSASQLPRRTRSSVRSQNARTSDVLPTPASPPTNTSRPAPAAASSSSSSSRSSNTAPPREHRPSPAGEVQVRTSIATCKPAILLARSWRDR